MISMQWQKALHVLLLNYENGNRLQLLYRYVRLRKRENLSFSTDPFFAHVFMLFAVASSSLVIIFFFHVIIIFSLEIFSQLLLYLLQISVYLF